MKYNDYFLKKQILLDKTENIFPAYFDPNI